MKSLKPLVVFVAALPLLPATPASGAVAFSEGSVVSRVDRQATFDSLTIVSGIDLSDYTEGGLSITVPDTSNVGSDLFHDGTLDMYHYGNAGNSSYVTIRGTDGAVMTALEFRIADGFGPGMSGDETWIAWETYLSGTLTGSFASTSQPGQAVEEGTIVGWIDPSGFDELRVGAGQGTYSLGDEQAIALDDVKAQLQTIPEPSSFVTWSLLGIISITAGFWKRRSNSLRFGRTFAITVAIGTVLVLASAVQAECFLGTFGSSESFDARAILFTDPRVNVDDFEFPLEWTFDFNTDMNTVTFNDARASFSGLVNTSNPDQWFDIDFEASFGNYTYPLTQVNALHDSGPMRDLVATIEGTYAGNPFSTTVTYAAPDAGAWDFTDSPKSIVFWPTMSARRGPDSNASLGPGLQLWVVETFANGPVTIPRSSLPCPERAPCNFNGDPFCDVADLNLLSLVGDLTVGVPVPNADPIFDLTEDGVVNSLDLSQWLIDAAPLNGFATPYLFGDADLDGDVDTDDFAELGNNWQRGTPARPPVPDPLLAWSFGDFDGDGDVDAVDFGELGNNWQKSIGSPTASQAVPEPNGTLFLVTLLAMVACRCNKYGQIE